MNAKLVNNPNPGESRVLKENMSDKVSKIKEIFKNIDPKASLEVVDHGDNTQTVQGPFPSFMLLVDDNEAVIRGLVHVNADAPNMVYVFGEFATGGLEIEQDGAFAINGETGQLLFNGEAYTKKEDNILMFAEEIKARRPAKKELIVPEKKIILAS